MRKWVLLITAALLLISSPAYAGASQALPLYVQIGTVYQDAHYGGRSQALNVAFVGDCDSSGYRVPMPTWGIDWSQIASSFTGSSSMPHCNFVALYAYRGPKKGTWWTGPLPVDHLGDWNDNISQAQFYHQCTNCQPVTPDRAKRAKTVTPAAPLGLRRSNKTAGLLTEQFLVAPCEFNENPIYGQLFGTLTGPPWSPWITYSFTRGNYCLVAPTSGPKLKCPFQDDGNWVCYRGNQVLWQSHTSGRGVKLSLQSDGNVVVYGAKGWIWKSGTDGLIDGIDGNNQSGLVTWMQADGNMIIASADLRPVWSWMTGLLV